MENRLQADVSDNSVGKYIPIANGTEAAARCRRCRNQGDEHGGCDPAALSSEEPVASASTCPLMWHHPAAAALPGRSILGNAEFWARTSLLDKSVAIATNRSRSHGPVLLFARRFSRWRFSFASSRRIASFGTVSTFRNAMSRRSAGLPPSRRFTGAGRLICSLGLDKVLCSDTRNLFSSGVLLDPE